MQLDLSESIPPLILLALNQSPSEKPPLFVATDQVDIENG
jgi:hypothetical protein